LTIVDANKLSDALKATITAATYTSAEAKTALEAAVLSGTTDKWSAKTETATVAIMACTVKAV